jgi:hypothetical protein
MVIVNETAVTQHHMAAALTLTLSLDRERDRKWKGRRNQKNHKLTGMTKGRPFCSVILKQVTRRAATDTPGENRAATSAQRFNECGGFLLRSGAKNPLPRTVV